MTPTPCIWAVQLDVQKDVLWIWVQKRGCPVSLSPLSLPGPWHTPPSHNLSDLAQSLLLGDDAYWPGAAEAPPWDSPRLTPSHRRKMNAQVLWPCTRRALFLRTQAAYLHLSAGADTEQAANTR